MTAAANDELTREQIVSIATAVAKERYGMTLEEFITAIKQKKIDDRCAIMEIIGLLSLLPEYESELMAA